MIREEKEKSPGEVCRNSCSFLMLSPSHVGEGVTHSIPHSQKQKCNNVSERFSTQGQGLVTWSYRRSLPSKYQNFRPKKESPAFGVNHRTANNVGTGNHAYQLEKGENTFQILAKGQLYKQALLEIAASVLLC